MEEEGRKQIVIGGKAGRGHQGTEPQERSRLSLKYHSSPDRQVTGRGLNVLITCWFSSANLIITSF